MTPSHNMGVDSGIQLNLKGWNVTAEGALIVMQRTRRIKSHLSTLISSISQPTERADNVKRGCRTQSFCAVKTSEGAASQRQDRRGGWLELGDDNRKMEEQKGTDWRLEISVSMRVHVPWVTPGKGKLKRTCVCVRPSVPHTPSPFSIQQRRWICAILPH